MPTIEAEQSLREISIVSAPHLKPRDRRSYIQRLSRAARRRSWKQSRPERKYPDAERDPVAAAAYFESLGMKVVKAG